MTYTYTHPAHFLAHIIYFDVIMELYKLLHCNMIVYVMQLYCMCCIHSCVKAHSTLVNPTSDRTVALLAHSINLKLYFCSMSASLCVHVPLYVCSYIMSYNIHCLHCSAGQAVCTWNQWSLSICCTLLMLHILHLGFW